MQRTCTAAARAAFIVAVCVTALPADAQSNPASQPDREQQTEDARENRRAALTEQLLKEYDLSNPQIPVELLQAGCPEKDCIPALTDPERSAVADAKYPAGDSRIVAVEINGEAVAYPLGILNWHEIANDTVGGVPIAVVYCPLCDSVTVMERTLRSDSVKDRVLEFGVSGLLANSNVVMYERATDGLWSQVLLKAITGPDAGRSLRHLPVKLMTFADFKSKYPNGEVLTTDTGHDRPYDRNPYAQYFKSDRVFMEMQYSDALPAKTLGLGIKAGDMVTFVPADLAANQPMIVSTPMGEVVVGAEPEVGLMVERAPKNAIVIQTFWHSWSAYFPETKIVKQPASTSQPTTQSK